MRRRVRRRQLCTLLSALCLGAWAQHLAAELRPNPFEPKMRSALAPIEGGAIARSQALDSVGAQSHPRLRGVLFAPAGSMANLAGHILSVQESALGYRLLSVAQHSAEFAYRGQRIQLFVSSNEEKPSQ